MEHNSTRKNARIVAILDLILTSLSLWGPIVLFIAATVATQKAGECGSGTCSFETDEGTREVIDSADWSTLSVILWVAFVVSLLMVVLELWAAIKLLNATQIGKDPLEAAKMARFWRVVCIVFTVFVAFGIIRQIKTGGLLVLISIVQLILRCIAIYIVRQFIVSSEQVAATSLPSRMPLGLTVGVGYTYMPTTTTAENDSGLPKYDDLPEKR
jgi:hypothetical protein